MHTALRKNVTYFLVKEFVMRLRNVFVQAAAIVMALTGLISIVHASTEGTWTWSKNNGDTGNWGNAANWTLTTGSGNPLYYWVDFTENLYPTVTITSNTDTGWTGILGLFFGGSTNYIINGTAAQYLQPSSSTNDDNGYGPGVVCIQVKGTGSDSFGAPIVVGSLSGGSNLATGFVIDQKQTYANNVFTISGSINGGNVPMTVQGAGNTSISGAISNVSTFTMARTGTLTLSGANTYTGNTNITSGTVQLSGSGTLGNGTGNLSIVNNAMLDLGGTTQMMGPIGAEGVGNGVVGNIQNGTVNIQANSIYFQNGTLNANVTSTPGSSARLHIGGDPNATVYLGGTNSMQASNAISIMIGDTNAGTAYTGPAGTVKLLPNSPNALGPVSQQVNLWAGTLDLNGNANVAVGSIRLKGGATSFMVNNNTSRAASYGGGVFLDTADSYSIGGSGNLTLSGCIQPGNINGGGINKIGGGTLTLSSANLYTGNTMISGGTLTLGNTNALAGSILDYNNYGGSLSFGGLTAAGFGGLQGAQNLALTNASSQNVALSVGSNNGASTTYSGVLSGGGSFNMASSGTLTLAGANTYTGNTTISGGTLPYAGTLILGNSNALSGSTLDYNSNGGSLSFGSLTSANFGGLQGNLSLALTNASTQNVALSVGGNNASTTYSGSLGGGGSFGKTGGGTLTLSGANTYTGNTTISGGTLNLGNSSALAGSMLDYNNYGGSLSFGSLTSANFGGLQGGQNLALTNASSQNVALTVGGNNAPTTYSGGLSGGGSLTKVGTGTFTLSGGNAANTYYGTTQVNAGTLVAGATNALSANSDVTVNGGMLNVSGYANTVKSLTLSSGTLDLGIGNVLTAAGAGNFSGGTIALSGSATLGRYALVRSGSPIGTVTSATSGVPTYYHVEVNGSELDLTHKATIGSITPIPNYGSIITGGSMPFTVNVGNSAPTSSDNLLFGVTPGSNVSGGISGISVPAGSSSGPVSGLSFTGSTIGPSQSGSFTVSDPNATNNPQFGSVSVNVDDHASPSLSTTTTTFGTVITGASVGNETTNLLNATGYRAGLQITNLGGLSGSTALIPAGGSTSLSAAVNTGTVGPYSHTYTVGLSDDQSLAGNTSLASQTFAVTGSVLNHASPSLSATTANFGTVITGASVGNETTNLLNATGYRAGLQVTNLGGLNGSTALISAGGSTTLSAAVNAGTVGAYSQSYTVGVSDDQSLAGNTPVASQTFAVTGSVLDHASPSLSTTTTTFGTVITGANVPNQPTNLLNATGYRAGLQITNLGGLSGSTALIPAGGSTTLSAAVNAGTVGAYSQSYTVGVSDQNLPGAVTLPSQNFTVTGSVLDHASPSLSTTTTTFGTVITGANVPNQPTNLLNATGYRAGLQITNLGGLSGSTALIPAGGSTTLSAAVNAGTVGAYSQSYTVGVSDDQSLAGNTPVASQTFAVTGSVLDHASPSLSTTTTTFGTVITGANVPNQPTNLQNATGYRAGLQITNLGGLSGSTALIPAGGSTTLSAAVNTGTVGAYSQSYTVGVSDDQSLAGNTPVASQTFAVTGSVLDHANASLSATSNQTTETINFGNILRGASMPSQSFTIYNLAANTTAAYTANMKLTGFTATGDAALTTNLSTFNGLTASKGNTYVASLNTSNYTTTGSTTVNMAASQLADDSNLSGAGNNNNGAMNIVLQGNVGNATADNSNSVSTFGTPLTAQVAKGGSYANLESTVTATSGSGGTGMLGSTATILDGTASAATTVSMAWRTRTTAETTKDGGGLLSDVVSLSGIAPNGTGSHDGFFQTDMYVLQMSYDPSELTRILGITESQAVAEGDLCLKSLNNGLIGIANNPWGCAVDENFGGTPNYVGDHAYNSSYFVLGDYGVDTTDHVVWSVVDYSGTFAAPEPSTFALLAAGALSLLAYTWRRRTMKAS